MGVTCSSRGFLADGKGIKQLDCDFSLTDFMQRAGHGPCQLFSRSQPAPPQAGSQQAEMPADSAQLTALQKHGQGTAVL